MFEALLFWLFVGFIVAIILGVVLYFALRWTFMRTAEKMASIVDRSVGGPAAQALTRLAAFARAHDLRIEDAQHLFGAHIDRLARLMDSAVKLPIIGRVGLDAVLDLIPVFGNFAGAAVSLTLIARTLQFGPPPALISRMLSNVLVDIIVGGIPLIGPLADIWWKANDRNAALMREFLDSRPTADQPS